jgi:hypothetical protein
MKNKNKILDVVFLIALVTSYTTNASLISLGNGKITTNTNDLLIVDHLNQREYLRLDVLGPLNYQEQIALTTNGQYADFTIADHQINFDFISALLDGKTGACNATRNVNGYCNKLSANHDVWREGQLGYSFTDNADYWLYENNQTGAFQDFGLAGILANGAILSFQNWSSLKSANNRSVSLTSPVHFLMYRDIPQPLVMPTIMPLIMPVVMPMKQMMQPRVVAVSEPSSALLFVLALIMLICSRLKISAS